MPKTYISPEKDAILRERGYDPYVIYSKLAELEAYKHSATLNNPLLYDNIQIGSTYQNDSNPANPFEEFINTYTNEVYNTAPKGLANFVPTVGLALSKEDGSAAKFFENWINNSTRFFDSYKLKQNATGQFLEDPSIVNFAGGLGQGFGFIASLFALGQLSGISKLGKFSRYAAGTAMASPILQTNYYTEAKNVGLDSKDAAIFSSVLAPVAGLSEYIGLEAVGNAMTKPLLNQVRRKAIEAGVKEFAEKGATKAAAYEAAALTSKAYAESFKEAFKNVAYRGTRAAFSEGGQEFVQSYLEEGAKQLYDIYFAESADKKFDADIKKNFKSAINDALFGGIIGFALGGGGSVYNPVFEESVFNVVDKAKNKDEIEAKLKKVLSSSLKRNRISEQEFQYGNQLVDIVKGFTTQQIPNTIQNPIARFQAFRLTSLSNDLQSQIKGNPVLTPDYIPQQIDAASVALKNIANTDAPIADFNGLLKQINEIELQYKRRGLEEEAAQGVAQAEEGVAEAVATGAEGIEMPAVEPLEVGAKMSRDEYDARMADIEAMRAQELEQFKDSLNEPIAAGSEQTIGQRIEDNYNQEIQKLNVQYEKEIYSVNDKNKVKPGVSELFDSDPELANDVYEALGFRKNIQFNEEDKINDFKNDKNTTVINVNDILNKETDPVTKELIKVLTPYLNKNTKIYYQDDYIFKGSSELALESSYAATIDGKGNILVFNKDYLNTDSVLHELMHDFLLDAININKDEVLINELTRIFNKAKTDTDLVESYSYAFSNLDEFVSEVFGNKGFRQELSYVKDYSLNKTSNIFQSVSNAIKDFLKRTFNFEISNTLLDSIFNAIESSVKNKNQITPQQKQQAQQLYSQYLDSIFPDSKVSKQDIEGFKKFVSKKEKDVEPLSEGVQGLRAEEERGKESPELRAEEEKVIKAQADLIEFENILERNQNNINDLRTKKLRKGETQEKRDMAIANLEEQNRILQEKIGGLREQVSATPSIAPSARAVFQQIQILRDNITAKGGKRKEKKEKFSKFVESQDEGIRQISDNFKEIVNQLESKGLLTKSSPEC